MHEPIYLYVSVYIGRLIYTATYRYLGSYINIHTFPIDIHTGTNLGEANACVAELLVSPIYTDTSEQIDTQDRVQMFVHKYMYVYTHRRSNRRVALQATSHTYLHSHTLIHRLLYECLIHRLLYECLGMHQCMMFRHTSIYNVCTCMDIHTECV